MSTVSAVLRAATACRLVELPRPLPRTDGQPRGDLGRWQRQAALVAAYHGATAGGAVPVVTGWWRPRRDGPVEVFAAGAIVAGEVRDGLVAVTVPVGGRGVPLGPGELGDRLRTLPSWVRLAGSADSLLRDPFPQASAPEWERPSLEDGLLRVWREPFAWLLVAMPVPDAERDRLAGQVADQERAARSRSSPEYQVRADRLSGRHRELRRAESDGLWSVHLLAGAADPTSAAVVASLLAASVDLTDLPYVLAPVRGTGDLEEVLDRTGPGTPFLASAGLVAAVTVGPRDEIPGLRLVLVPDFDVTPEPPAVADSGGTAISLGAVLDRNRQPVDDLVVPTASLNRHTFVCGATGAGKSHTIRHLLAQASRAGIPWLVIEPAKAEYRQLAARLGPGTVHVIRPGDPDAPPVGLNPLEPAPGFPLQTHVDLVRALFLAAFAAEEPFPQVLAAALTRCYEAEGWDLVVGEPMVAGHRPRYPTLGDLQRTADQVVDRIGYGKEIADNVRGFVRVRLSSLRLGTTGRFFEGGHPVDFGRLLARNVVFEIEDVGDDQDKAFLIGTVLVRLVEHLRVELRVRPELAEAGLRHLCVIEEAHRLLRHTERPGPARHAVELFAALLAEIRAYGEGLVVSEQIPGKLVPDVIKNTAVKVMHRLPAQDDRDAVGATCNLDERQSQYLVTLAPGTAVVFTDGMDRPILVQVPETIPGGPPGSPATGSVAELVERRSDLCGDDCRAEPCTLRQLRAAQLVAATTRWLSLWAELAALGHLTGWGAPLPRRTLLADLTAMPTRLRDCAVGQAIDQAVAVRSTVLGVGVGPNELAAHLAVSMTGMTARVLRCAAEEPEWLARPYRWIMVLDELRAAVRADAGGGPHPRTTEWSRSYGRRLPAAACTAQLEVVRGWFAADARDPEALRTVAFGADRPAVVEQAVGAQRTDPDWSDRLAAALDWFHDCRWPRRYLAPAANRREDR